MVLLYFLNYVVFVESCISSKCRWCFADARVEEFVYEKVQGSKPQRMLENDVLGQHMIDAGNDFGPGTAYGQFSVLHLHWAYSGA